jgi:hypothetical protein
MSRRAKDQRERLNDPSGFGIISHFNVEIAANLLCQDHGVFSTLWFSSLFQANGIQKVVGSIPISSTITEVARTRGNDPGFVLFTVSPQLPERHAEHLGSLRT